MNNSLDILMLAKQSDSDFKSYLLNGWKIVTASHDAALDELLSTHFLELRESLVLFEFLISFEVVPREHLAVAVEIQLGQKTRAAVSYQVTVLTDGKVCDALLNHIWDLGVCLEGSHDNLNIKSHQYID